ncbi:MAG: hypothetical protein MUF39_07135 [Cyclobacteriaceae bacterium]|nr:hypothetical protein [Cyclobacteriaceae bacterium]
MKLLCAFLFVLLPSLICAQAPKEVPLLERKVTLSATNEKTTSVLSRLGQTAGFSFSYNSAIIPDEQLVTIDVENKPVREALNILFQGTMNYKVKSNYVILTRAPAPVAKNNIVTIFINGYVQDLLTGEKIAQASVYDKKSLVSVTTDEYGYFNLKLDKKTDTLQLSISKKNYRDTLVNISTPENQYISLYLTPIKADTVMLIPDVADSAVVVKKDEFTFPYQTEPNVANINDTLHRLVQVSFLPFIGTNERLSGNVINDYSINFLGGYSMGTRQIELGFFLNMDRADVSWLQIAGFGNMVGGNMYGIQAAGFFNLNGGQTTAVQLAGFANTNLDDTEGVQVAGFANTNIGAMRGVQVAGFSNVNNLSSTGVQVAGFGNVQVGDYRGSQFAGIANITSEKIYGSQIAGLYNFGRSVQGTQIGLFNYADSLGGIPIGLLSIVKTGYHKIELSADEVFYTNLAFRTGMRKFYTMIHAGFKPDKSINPGDSSVWTFGYGLGTARKISNKIFLNLDLSAQHVNKGSFTDALSLLNKFNVGVDFQLTKGFSLYTGATLNAYLTDIDYTDYPTLFTDFKPNVFYDKNINGNNLKMWVGAKVALRFL